ncbi:MAG: hypothetical protein ACLRJV_08725 [Eubacteriales bacterium]
MTRLTARLYEYPKGHPCRGCPLLYGLRSILYVPQPEGRRVPLVRSEAEKTPPLPHTYPQNQAAADGFLISLKFSKM